MTRFHENRTSYQEMLEIRRRLAQANDTPQSQRDQFYLLVKVTRTTFDLNQVDKAQTLLEETLTLYEQVKELYTDHDDLRDLWWVVGLIRNHEEQREIAQESFKQAIKHSKEFLKEANTPYHQSLHDELLSDQERLGLTN